MAHTTGIEQLTRDTLGVIMTCVAAQPDGAAAIVNTFAVSKTFRTFVTDGDVLRAVSFKDLLVYLCGQYELLSEVDGLVARCSRAGNLTAQLLLSKIALVSASKLCNAKMEPSDFFPSTEYSSLSDVDKAARLLNHLSRQNTDPTELVILVRNFLCRAEVRHLVEMKYHLKNFVALYFVPEKKPEHLQFLAMLDKSLKKFCFEYLFSLSNPFHFIIEKYNTLRITAHNKMKLMGMDEEIIRPLLECSVELNGDVVYEAMIERVGIVIPILKLGCQVAAAAQHNNDNVLLAYRDTLDTARLVIQYFENLIEHKVFAQSGRGLLVASFDALFNLQQGSP